MPCRLIDLSHPLDATTPPWPGNPPVSVEQLHAIPATLGIGKDGAYGQPGYANVTAITVCAHTGTHIDAPAHFYNGVPTIEKIPLSQCIGPCTLIDLKHVPPRQEITEADLQPYRQAIALSRKVVLNTGWSSHWGQPDYFNDFPVLGKAAAEWLVANRVELIGLDAPSVDRDPHPIHFILLGAHMVIVENLTGLDAIGRDYFELIVAPLSLTGLEASPVRVVARIDD